MPKRTKKKGAIKGFGSMLWGLGRAYISVMTSKGATKRLFFSSTGGSSSSPAGRNS